MFPNVIVNGNNEPMCKTHAVRYWGAERINHLIAIQMIRCWRPVETETEENADSKTEG